MGQQNSKSYPPLTFGYVNHARQYSIEDGEEEFSLSENNSRNQCSTDFVLANPHLYRLENICRHCFTAQEKHYASTSENVIVANKVSSSCQYCQKSSGMSLTIKDLANDLNYIDETYYPDIIHYADDEDILLDDCSILIQDDTNQDDDDETNTLRSEEGWSKLTFGEVTPTTPNKLAPSPNVIVDLSGRSLIKLSSSISYLNNLTKLDLSNNQMINLPKAIGQLKNLRIFNASKNQLESIPDTLTTLNKLKIINLSHNKLSHLPKCMGQLSSLVILIINNNQLVEIPRSLASLENLINLSVSHNPIRTIPAEIANMRSLQKLFTEECPFEEEIIFSAQNDPPSLLEICARTVIKQSINLPSNLSPHIKDYFKKEQTCSFCCGPYFDSFVKRGRFIERPGRQLIALDYKLCSAHWTDENDRLSAMFSTPYYKPLSQQTQQQTQLQATRENQTIASSSSHQIDDESSSEHDSSERHQDSESYNESSLRRSGSHHAFSNRSSVLSINRHTMGVNRSKSSGSIQYCSKSILENNATTSSNTANPHPSSSNDTSCTLLLPSSSSSSPIPQLSHHHLYSEQKTTQRPRSCSITSLTVDTSEQCIELQPILAENPSMLPFIPLYSNEQSSSSQRKKHFSPNGIKQGFAQLGAKLSKRHNKNGRDRSETV